MRSEIEQRGPALPAGADVAEEALRQSKGPRLEHRWRRTSSRRSIAAL